MRTDAAMAKGLLAMALALLCLGSACDQLGGGNYKAEVATVADRIRSDLASANVVSAATSQRLDALLAKYQAEHGESSSYKNMKDVQGLLQMMAENPGRAVNFKQSLESELQKALSDLQSETP